MKTLRMNVADLSRALGLRLLGTPLAVQIVVGLRRKIGVALAGAWVWKGPYREVMMGLLMAGAAFVLLGRFLR